MEHFIEAQQLNDELISDLFSKADAFEKTAKQNLKLLDGRIMAALFYEPSTRTRFSFESAMERLGGKVISTEAAKMFSSAAKGESLEDTIRVVGKYCDVIVMRHGDDDAAERAASVSPVPFINAGSGTNQHPTQALLDVYSIKKELGRLNGLKVAMVGDLKQGRTTHSLSYLLSKFKDNELIFVSPENLKMKSGIKEHLDEHNVKYREETNLEKVLPEADIIYMTRVQKERLKFPHNTWPFSKLAQSKYSINKDNLQLVRKDARILHPLPHVKEINLPIAIEETDPRVAYFRQAEGGLYTRMALLWHLLKK